MAVRSLYRRRFTRRRYGKTRRGPTRLADRRAGNNYLYNPRSNQRTIEWTVPRNIGIGQHPARAFTKHTFFSTYYAVNSVAAGSTGVQLFRGNSPYDPDYSLGGASASLFNTMAALYAAYKVIGSRISIYPSGSYSVTWCVTPLNTTTTFGIVEQAAAIPASKVLVTGNAASIMQRSPISCYKTTVEMIGRDLTNDDLGGGSASNPLMQWFWHVYMKNSSVGAQDCGFVVRIDYYTEWCNPVAQYT